MYSRTQSEQDGKTNRPFSSSYFNINRFDFRSALVIEQSDVLRRSIVEHLKNRGWIVHGIKRAEQALPVLQHIPYHLIVIDSEISGMTAIEFARIIHESGKWRATQLVIITGSRCRSSVEEFTECGAFVVKRSVWREGLSKLFANFKRPENDGTILIPTGAAKNWPNCGKGRAPALRMPWTRKTTTTTAQNGKVRNLAGENQPTQEPGAA
jgi:CheY-like chemotaxis protein